MTRSKKIAGKPGAKDRRPKHPPQPPKTPKTPFPWPELEWSDVGILAAIAAVYSWICFRNIRQPGLYGDEAWAAIAAARFVWGTPADPAAHHKLVVFGHAVPMMLNPYTGPVKAWILITSFALFGVSVPVIRATSGMVGLLGIAALYFLARSEFGRLAAAAVALLAASDVSLALALRCDWGPIDFAFFARTASMLLLLAWRNNRSHPVLLFAGTLLLGLGVCYKFDFAGTAVAILLAGAIAWGGRLGLRLRDAGIALLGFLAGSWPILLYNVVYPAATFRAGQEIASSAERLGFFEAIGHRLGVLRDLWGGVIGEFFLGGHFQSRSPLGNSIERGALFLVPLLAAVPFFVARLSGWKRAISFFAMAAVFILLGLAAVPMAGGPHHVIALYPVPHLLLGAGLAALWLAGDSRRPELRGLFRGTAAAGFAVLLVSNLALAQAFHKTLAERGGSRYWSESIYELAGVLQKEHPDDVIELLDWGIEQPLIVLAKDRLHLHALYWQVQSDPRAEEWLATLVRRPQRVFVRRAKPFAFDPAVHDRFDAVLARSPDLQVEEKKIFQKDGQLSFTILRVRPPA